MPHYNLATWFLRFYQKFKYKIILIFNYENHWNMLLLPTHLIFHWHWHISLWCDVDWGRRQNFPARSCCIWGTIPWHELHLSLAHLQAGDHVGQMHVLLYLCSWNKFCISSLPGISPLGAHCHGPGGMGRNRGYLWSAYCLPGNRILSLHLSKHWGWRYYPHCAGDKIKAQRV